MKVAVIIPAYNRVEELLRAIASLERQTQLPSEWIVVDDGSTDRSPELLAGYARIDPRRRVWRQANGGISVALHGGIAEARGE